VEVWVIEDREVNDAKGVRGGGWRRGAASREHGSWEVAAQSGGEIDGVA
jgi:hypothetical protein